MIAAIGEAHAFRAGVGERIEIDLEVDLVTMALVDACRPRLR
jgi:hypothetical protein